MSELPKLFYDETLPVVTKHFKLDRVNYELAPSEHFRKELPCRESSCSETKSLYRKLTAGYGIPFYTLLQFKQPHALGTTAFELEVWRELKSLYLRYVYPCLQKAGLSKRIKRVDKVYAVAGGRIHVGTITYFAKSYVRVSTHDNMVFPAAHMVFDRESAAYRHMYLQSRAHFERELQEYKSLLSRIRRERKKLRKMMEADRNAT